ncbi:MAG: mechanosensitive ion channel family protein [Armatimonadota bacterium]
MLARSVRALACVPGLLAIAAAWAQAPEETAEPPAEPPDVAETLGAWWEKIQEPEFLARVIAALINMLTVAVITGIVYTVVMLLFRRAVARIERQTAQAVQPDRRRKQRVITVIELVRSIAKWVILITGGVWVLASAGVDIRPALVGAGVLGLAIGFGAQNLVRDLMSGFFMLLEGQYAVGDYVQVGANFGMVESIGMRVTVLKDLDNRRHFLPNGTISAITVYDEPFVNYIVELPLARREDADRAVEVIRERARVLAAQYRRYLVHHGVPHAAPADAAAVVRLPIAVLPTQEWLANDEIPASLKEALAEAEIALREGRVPRTYTDLSRMPEYRYGDETDEAEVI